MTSKAFENATDANRQQGGRRNLIINGAMQVAQRGTSSTADTAGAYYTLDRFSASSSATLGSFDTAQSTDAPNGFSNSFKFSVNTAGSGSTSTEQAYIQQLVEAQNLQHLAYGTSDAKEMTFSFWAKSTETGTKVVWFYAADGGRHYAQTFALSQANTWEYFTISIPADTSGTINNDNGAGFYVRFVLESGTGYTGGIPDSGWTAITNNRYSGVADFMQTASNEFYITGVQLEVGSVATPFEHRSYGEELALCQRYYYRETYESNNYQFISLARVNGASGTTNQNSAVAQFKFPVTQRAIPTLYFSSAGAFRLNDNTNDEQCNSINGGSSSPYFASLSFVKPTSNFYGNHICYVNRQLSTTPCWLAWDAEL